NLDTQYKLQLAQRKFQQTFRYVGASLQAALDYQQLMIKSDPSAAMPQSATRTPMSSGKRCPYTVLRLKTQVRRSLRDFAISVTSCGASSMAQMVFLSLA